MEAPKPNPLLSHILGAVADRGAAELGKLELLARIASRLDLVVDQVGKQTELLEELVERTRK